MHRRARGLAKMAQRISAAFVLSSNRRGDFALCVFAAWSLAASRRSRRHDTRGRPRRAGAGTPPATPPPRARDRRRGLALRPGRSSRPIAARPRTAFRRFHPPCRSCVHSASRHAGAVARGGLCPFPCGPGGGRPRLVAFVRLRGVCSRVSSPCVPFCSHFFVDVLFGVVCVAIAFVCCSSLVCVVPRDSPRDAASRGRHRS